MRLHATSVTDAQIERRNVDPDADAAGSADAMTLRRWAMLFGAWLAVAAFLILLQRGRVTATVFSDELTFGRLAENIGNGLGETFNGLHSSQPSVYPYLIAPAWTVFEDATAYRAALAINALVMTTVIFPTFAIARTVAGFRTALACAALTALVPSMVWAGMVMTESLAYPAAALALLAILFALRRPGLLTALLAGASIIAAYFARTQLLALGGVLALAVLLEIARHGRSSVVSEARRHRWVLIGGALAAALVGLIVFRRKDLVGGYSCVLQQPPGPGELAPPVLDYLGTFAIACGLLPPIGLLALAASPRAWRDDRSGPVLCVALAAAAVLIVQAAWTVVVTSPELQERYVFYAAPAIIPLLAALPGRVGARTLLAAAAVAIVYFALLFPGFADVTGAVIADRIGLTGPLADVLSNQKVLWVAAAAVLGGTLFLVLRHRNDRTVGAALALTAVFTVPVLGARQLDANSASSAQAQRYQRPLMVVDDIAGSRPSAVVIVRGSSLIAAFQIQLWNQSVGRVFRVGVADEIGVGRACPVRVATDGTLSARGLCGGDPLPSVLVLLDGDEDHDDDDGDGVRLAPGNGSVRAVGQGIRVWQVQEGTAPRLKLSKGDATKGDAKDLQTPPDAPPGTPNGRCNGT